MKRINKLYEFMANVSALPDGTTVQLGIKSESMPWMDMKYGVTKEILRMLARLPKLKVTIFTSSDLVAHEEYTCLLKQIRDVMVCMRLPRSLDEAQLRIKEPGAPSLLRRERALEKLAELNIKCMIDERLAWEAVV